MAIEQFTEQQQLFLDLLYAEGIPDDLVERAKDVKERAGYSAQTNVYQILRALKDAITERTQEFIVMGAGASVRTLQDIVRTPTSPGADTAIKAANSLLDRAALAKRETMEIEHKISQGIVVLPAKRE